MSSTHVSTPATSATAEKKPKPNREQKFAPSSHLYLQGRLSNIYLNWENRTSLVVIPHQRVFKLTELYPLDLGYLFQEIYSVMEQKRVQNFTISVFKRDWNVAPHLFLRVSMHQDLYKEFLTTPHINSGFVPPNPVPRVASVGVSPPVPPPPTPQAAAPTEEE